MAKRWLAAALLLCVLTVPALVHAQASCASSYTTPCIGSTVCFTATATSQQIVPVNYQRRYLLIQSQSATTALYFALGPGTTTAPLGAVIGANTMQLVPPGNNQLPNYEVSSLNATATPPPRVPSGAISVITSGGSVGVCVTEANG